MTADPNVTRLLRQIFDSVVEEQEQADFQKRRWEFVFHMSDWQDDLEELYQLFSEPDRQDACSAARIVVRFLCHVIPHLNAAGRLLLAEMPDEFSQLQDP